MLVNLLHLMYIDANPARPRCKYTHLSQSLISALGQVFFFPAKTTRRLSRGLKAGGESEFVVRTAQLAASPLLYPPSSLPFPLFPFSPLHTIFVFPSFAHLRPRMRRLGKVLSTMASDVVRDGVFGRHILILLPSFVASLPANLAPMESC